MEDKNINVITEGSHSTIQLKGSLTLPNIGNIKTAVENVMAKSKSLMVETMDVDEVDLSFFQLIVSIKAYCKAHSVDIITKIQLPQDAEQLFAKANLKF